MSRQHPWRADNPDAALVARPSKWGNPFTVDDYHSRELAVDAFRAMVNDPMSRAHCDYPEPDEIRAELVGHDLACWCPLVDKDGSPVPCHADVLLEIANAPH